MEKYFNIITDYLTKKSFYKLIYYCLPKNIQSILNLIFMRPSLGQWSIKLNFIREILRDISFPTKKTQCRNVTILLNITRVKALINSENLIQEISRYLDSEKLKLESLKNIYLIIDKFSLLVVCIISRHRRSSKNWYIWNKINIYSP